jgi:transposase
MESSRKSHTAVEKVAAVRKHLVEKAPVSEVCAQHGIHPTIFYRWQKTLFERGGAAFEAAGAQKRGTAQEQKLAALEAKIRRKDEVLAELMEEHVALKKTLGES